MRKQAPRFGRASLLVVVVLASVAMGTFIGRTLAQPQEPSLRRSDVLTYKEGKRFKIDLVKPSGTFTDEDNITNVVCMYTAEDGGTQTWPLRKKKLSHGKKILTLVFDSEKPPKKGTPVVPEGDIGAIQISLQDVDAMLETGEIDVEEVDVNPCGNN